MRTPNGIRTRAAAVKGRCPRPLDDGGSGTTALDFSAAVDSNNYRGKFPSAQNETAVTLDTVGFSLIFGATPPFA